LDKAAIYEKLKGLLVSELGLDADSISPEKRLYDDLRLDSLDMVDLILTLSHSASEKNDSASFKKLRTIQDLVDLVYSHRK